LQEHEFERLGGTRTIKVDVRILAATNKDLEKSVEEGSFREDLFYRLKVIPVTLPPLRDRRVDIPLLVHHFLTEMARVKKMKMKSIAKDALSALEAYDWPGNVRELENVIERMLILSEGDYTLEMEDLPEKIARRASRGPVVQTSLPEEGFSLSNAVNDFERQRTGRPSFST
jgi:transcriptional regulator with PAS, ATPase and Fis domain